MFGPSNQYSYKSKAGILRTEQAKFHTLPDVLVTKKIEKLNFMRGCGGGRGLLGGGRGL